MAELVEEMQERLLPEYEQMQKFQICTDEQLREFIQKRSKFQARITRNHKTMRDYLDFIIFERKIHKWICEKEDELGTKLSGLKASIAKRILRLYREGLKRFPHEERLWQNYIQFCKKSAPNEVPSIYERMLTIYGDKEKVWCDAALWAYQSRVKLPKVKEMFYRALLRHPQSEMINKTFFDILLIEASKMSNEKNLAENTKSEQEIGLEIVLVAYSNSRKYISNLSYYLSLLERCEEPEYSSITIILQKQIIDDLMETYASKELLWDALAQRELRGFSTTDLRKSNRSELTDGSSEPKLVWLHRTEKQRIDLCCKVYETAVETMKTEKMWTLYINAMLKLNQDTPSELPTKRKRLALAFKSAQESCSLNDDHLEAYIRLLMVTPNGVENAKNVLEKFSSHRSSLKFFELWLEIYIVAEDAKMIEEIFQKAKATLGVESRSIWMRVVDFYKHKGNNKCLDAIYKEASHQPQAEFAIFRSEFLVHSFKTSTMNETRKIYTDLLQLPPPCLEMQQKMLELETTVNPKDINRLRLYHEQIVHFFGKTNPDVWLDFMKFERDHGKPQNVHLLYSRAKASLDPHLVDAFITAHTLSNAQGSC